MFLIISSGRKWAFVLAFSLWIHGICYILNVSIRYSCYCFNAQLFSVWPVGATLNWFLCSSDSTLFVLEYFLAFMCNKIVLAYPKNPLFLSFITEIIYEYILIRTVDNLCSMLSEVWRLSISSGWWIFFESFSFAFTYKLVLKALIFT